MTFPIYEKYRSIASNPTGTATNYSPSTLLPSFSTPQSNRGGSPDVSNESQDLSEEHSSSATGCSQLNFTPSTQYTSVSSTSRKSREAKRSRAVVMNALETLRGKSQRMKAGFRSLAVKCYDPEKAARQYLTVPRCPSSNNVATTLHCGLKHDLSMDFSSRVHQTQYQDYMTDPTGSETHRSVSTCHETNKLFAPRHGNGDTALDASQKSCCFDLGLLLRQNYTSQERDDIFASNYHEDDKILSTTWPSFMTRSTSMCGGNDPPSDLRHIAREPTEYLGPNPSNLSRSYSSRARHVAWKSRSLVLSMDLEPASFGVKSILKSRTNANADLEVQRLRALESKDVKHFIQELERRDDKRGNLSNCLSRLRAYQITKYNESQA